jgi:hypothetical protein
MTDKITTNFSNNSTYYPLCISYSENGIKWSLDFQLKPEPKIIFTGDTVPTDSEFVWALGASTLPVVIIPVFRIIIADILARRND